MKNAKPQPGSVQRDVAPELTSRLLVPEPEMDEQAKNAATAQIAFALWQKRGSPDGSSEEDWFAAEKVLRGS